MDFAGWLNKSLPAADFLDPSGYVKSFPVPHDIGEDKHTHTAEPAKEFFEEHGFVVFEGVFDTQECEITRDSMWNMVEQGHDGLKRDEPHTWSKYQSTGKYGLSSRGPVFDPVRDYQRIDSLFYMLRGLLLCCCHIPYIVVH